MILDNDNLETHLFARLIRKQHRLTHNVDSDDIQSKAYDKT